MQPLIDWISFTVSTQTNLDGSPKWLDPSNINLVKREVMTRLATALGGNTVRTMFPELPPGADQGRFPYRYSSQDPLTGIRTFFDPNISHILVEISGRGCRAISGSNQITKILVDVGDSCSRLDISADIETDTKPIEFLSAGYNRKFRATSVQTSDSGQTCYVGSPKSDRQAAIYRYYEPHPRAHLLRVEHRFRRERARDMAQYIVEHGVTNALIASGEAYGWEHRDWNPHDIAPVPLPKIGVDAKDSSVARWLLTQVFPAMRRYEREGKIEDLRAFVQLYLFDDDTD